MRVKKMPQNCVDQQLSKEKMACTRNCIDSYPSFLPDEKSKEKKGWTKKWAIPVLPAVFAALICLIFFLFGVVILTKNCACGDAPLSPHSHPPCPPHWIWYQGKCFFFSEGEKNWTSSQSFCSSHGGSLTRITDEEKNFMRLLKGKDAFWIGLTRSPGQPWKWLDGENATLKVLGNGGTCAYLDRELTACTARCSIPFRWMCSKPVQFETSK